MNFVQMSSKMLISRVSAYGAPFIPQGGQPLRALLETLLTIEASPKVEYRLVAFRLLCRMVCILSTHEYSRDFD